MSCTTRFVAPIVRIAVTELVLHAGLVIIFRDEADVTATGRNARQFPKSWKAPPRFYAHTNIFASDGDPAAFNVLGHGLFGSETYIAARGWGHSPGASFLFSLVASAFWEYVIESWYQPPSAIDLLWTPVGGLIIGEARYQAYKAAQKGIAHKVPRTIVFILLDPLGELERLIMNCER
jgi:hypothetical protein